MRPAAPRRGSPAGIAVQASSRFSRKTGGRKAGSGCDYSVWLWNLMKIHRRVRTPAAVR